jgi:hypothetical protein
MNPICGFHEDKISTVGVGRDDNSCGICGVKKIQLYLKNINRQNVASSVYIFK